VENAVGFIQPAGLVVYGVRKRATRLRRTVLAELFAAERVDGCGFRRIEKRGGIADLNARVDGGDAQGDRDADRNLAADFNQIGPVGEAFGCHREAVDAKGKFRNDVSAFGGDGKIALELVGAADQLGRGRGRAALGVVYLDTEFAALALGRGGSGPSGKRQGGGGQKCQMPT